MRAWFYKIVGFLSLIALLAVFLLPGQIAWGQAKFLNQSQQDAAIVAGAAGYDPGSVSYSSAQRRLLDTVTNVLRYMLGFLGTIAVIIVLYAGFLWMTAGGQQDRIETAQKYLKNGVIGLLIIFSAYAIVVWTAYYLFKATDTGPEPLVDVTDLSRPN